MSRVTWREAVWAGDLLNVSGQLGIAVGPKGRALVTGDGKSRESLVAAQTQQALKNLIDVVEANGLTAADVVKTTVYLAKFDDYDAMNEEYAKVFHTNPPARQTLAAYQLWNGAVFEVDCWAYRKPKS